MIKGWSMALSYTGGIGLVNGLLSILGSANYLDIFSSGLSNIFLTQILTIYVPESIAARLIRIFLIFVEFFEKKYALNQRISGVFEHYI